MLEVGPRRRIMYSLAGAPELAHGNVALSRWTETCEEVTTSRVCPTMKGQQTFGPSAPACIYWGKESSRYTIIGHESQKLESPRNNVRMRVGMDSTTARIWGSLQQQRRLPSFVRSVDPNADRGPMALLTLL